MPDIQPDWNAPGISLVQQIASWVLGLGLTITIIALIVAVITIAFKGFGNQGMQQTASKNILWVALAVVVLGSVMGIFHWLVGIDLGIPGA